MDISTDSAEHADWMALAFGSLLNPLESREKYFCLKILLRRRLRQVQSQLSEANFPEQDQISCVVADLPSALWIEQDDDGMLLRTIFRRSLPDLPKSTRIATKVLNSFVLFVKLSKESCARTFTLLKRHF